jgi:hypothetical protein
LRGGGETAGFSGEAEEFDTAQLQVIKVALHVSTPRIN